MSNNSGPGYAKHPEHRVGLEHANERVIVTFDGEVIADTTDAIRLREATYPPVYYVPRRDVKMDRLIRTEHHTYCPFKGEASYFSLSSGRRAENAVWSYEKPYDEVIDIKDLLAFYPDRVDSIAAAPTPSSAGAR
jgi:uncharacterized protein (DUF427 family)